MTPAVQIARGPVGFFVSPRRRALLVQLCLWATGDRLLTRQRLFDDANKAIGTLFTDCVNVGASAHVFAATLQCTATYRFDDGQVVLTGVLHVGTAGTSAPIAGGSGAYRGARGEVTTGKPDEGYDIDVLHIDG